MPKITSKIPDPDRFSNIYDRGGKNDFAHREPTLNDKNNGLPKRTAFEDFKHKAYFNDVYSRRSSGLALECFLKVDRSHPIWIPISQIDVDSEVWLGQQHGTLVVSEWIAEQKLMLGVADNVVHVDDDDDDG